MFVCTVSYGLEAALDVTQTIINEECQHIASATYRTAPKISMQSIEELQVNSHVSSVHITDMKPQHLNFFLL
jgi:hypothetical protein